MMHMKLSIVVLTLLCALAAISQTAKPSHKHQVVFELNSPGPDAWNQMLGNIDNVKKAFAPDDVQVEVVAFGKGVTILLKSNTAYEERLKKMASEGVALSACQNSM